MKAFVLCVWLLGCQGPVADDVVDDETETTESPEGTDPDGTAGTDDQTAVIPDVVPIEKLSIYDATLACWYPQHTWNRPSTYWYDWWRSAEDHGHMDAGFSSVNADGNCVLIAGLPADEDAITLAFTDPWMDGEFADFPECGLDQLGDAPLCTTDPPAEWGPVE